MPHRPWNPRSGKARDLGHPAFRKSKSPPCRRKRDKDGAPSRVEMSERVGQPPCSLLGYAVVVRIFIDESGTFGWAPPDISLHCAVISCSSALVELFRRHLEWKTSILGPHKRREIKGSSLSDIQLEQFVSRVILPTPDLKLTVVGIDTRITPKQRLEEWRDGISHYCLGASEFSRTRDLHPADRQYKEMSGWLWNRSPENLGQMISLGETIARVTQNAVIWFHDEKFESEFADFEVAIDRGFVRNREHEMFWREFFRGSSVNKFRQKPFIYPERWSKGRHVFGRLCSNADGELDLSPIFRDRTYFVDSSSSEGVQIADICANVCLRYHRRERWFDAYRALRPLIVDVEKGPMTLLVPANEGGLGGAFATTVQEEVAVHAKLIPPRTHRT